MPAPRIKTRTYFLRVQRPINLASSDCKDFREVVVANLHKGRELLKLELPTTGEDCVVEAKVRCSSCGLNSLHRFSRTIGVTFADAQVKIGRDRA